MLTVLWILFILIYLWYWIQLPNPFRYVSRPDGTDPTLNTQLVQNNSWFHFENQNLHHFENGTIKWQTTLPSDSNFYFDNLSRRFKTKDACFLIPNGFQVPAKGKALYDYLSSHPTSFAKSRSFHKFADTITLQKGQVFYFTCQNGKIDRVDMCPSGYVFEKGACQNIGECTNRAKGTTFADPMIKTQYYRCNEKGEAILQTCPPNHWFINDSCRNQTDTADLCRQIVTGIMQLNPYTRLSCRDGRMKSLETCQKGFRFFDGNECESEACMHQPDFTRLPLKEKIIDNFKFWPGYVTCKNDRVMQTHFCPGTWNRFDTNEQLFGFPQVFDGNDCAIPQLCTNVRPIHPDTIVPVYDFSKHVGNWGYSQDIDSVTGITCQGLVRKRKAVEPGFVINPKRYRVERDTHHTKTFLSGRFDAYYDQTTDTITPCKQGEIFDGDQCRPSIDTTFAHNGLGLFRFAKEDWIPGFTYNSEPDQDCNGSEESVFLQNYNTCSHPDCIKYPFLSQIPGFFIVSKDSKHACIGTQDLRIKKIKWWSKYDYWIQRLLDYPTLKQTPCKPGEKIKSGHFAFDSTIYATCDDTQPFVFCPFNDMVGIENYEGKRWACVPKDALHGILKVGQVATFQKNELNQIRALDSDTNPPRISIDDQLVISLNQPWIVLPNKGIKVQALDRDVQLVYRYRNSFPPDVAFKNGKVTFSHKEKEGALLSFRDGFTMRAVTMPKFDTVWDSVSDFYRTLKQVRV